MSYTIQRQACLLLCATFFCCFISCKESKEHKKTFNKENFKEHYIDEIKGTLLLPKDYQKLTAENRAYLFSSTKNTDVIQDLTASLDRNRIDYVLFSKEDSPNDVIAIAKIDHVDFSKRDANQYLGFVEQNLRSTWQHINYVRLENRMTQTNKSKYIKIKYELQLDPNFAYQTMYIVSSAISTFQVIELHGDSYDNEDLIKRINFKE